MSHSALFRSMVFISAVFYVVSYFLPYDAFEGTSTAVKLLTLDGYEALFNPRSSLLGSGILVLWLIAAMGLLHFDNWARHLYLGLTVWSLIAAGLYGIRVSSPLEEVVDLVVSLLDGAILAMAYFSRAADLFRK
jgi:hypothetical protein